MADAKTKLFIFATICPKPEHFDAAKAALQEIIPPTLDEPGCQIFAVFESKTEDLTLNLFGCFDDAAALSEHYEYDHTKVVLEKYQAWLSAPVDVKTLTACGPVSLDQFAG